LSPIPTRPTGPTGPTGPPGARGRRGEEGEEGKRGKRGATGATGPTGLPGVTGATGATGEAEGCLCDCCVTPMQNVLQQLIGETVIILTVADTPNTEPSLSMVTPTSVNDFLAFVTDGVTNSVVTTADVIATGFIPPGPRIILIPPIDSGCECDCRERPLRVLFNTLIGARVSIKVSNGSLAENFLVEGTGLGIVIGLLTINDGADTIRVAFSLCHVTQVILNPPVNSARNRTFFS